MSFRQFGGLNYAAKHNAVSSNYNTSNNFQVTQNVGQPSSYINFLSDISANNTTSVGTNIIQVFSEYNPTGNKTGSFTMTSASFNIIGSGPKLIICNGSLEPDSNGSGYYTFTITVNINGTSYSQSNNVWVAYINNGGNYPHTTYGMNFFVPNIGPATNCTLVFEIKPSGNQSYVLAGTSPPDTGDYLNITLVDYPN
jgi:hypothetical protein